MRQKKYATLKIDNVFPHRYPIRSNGGPQPLMHFYSVAHAR